MSELKHIIINDEPFLVEETVWDFILCLSKEAERTRGTLPCAVMMPGIRINEGCTITAVLTAIERRQQASVSVQNIEVEK